MNLDSARLEKVLTRFAQDLPSLPKWVGLVDHHGNLISSVGSFDDSPDTNSTAAQQLKLFAERNYEGLEAVGHGNFQISIVVGGRGTLFILNMNDAFFLGVSYHGIGDGCCYSSIDSTEEAIRHGSQMIGNAIYLDTDLEILQPVEAEEGIDSNDKTDMATSRQLMDDALSRFVKGISGKPRWAIVLNDEGRLIGFSGEMHKARSIDEDNIDPKTYAPLLGRYIHDLYAAMDDLSLKPFKRCILSTGRGFTFIQPLIDHHYLVFNYLELSRPIETISESVRLEQGKIIQILSEKGVAR